MAKRQKLDPATISERTLPHSLEAERSVLGAVLASNALWGKVASALTADDFFRDAHRRIFTAMTTLVEQATPIDYVTLKNALFVQGDLDAAGGFAYISSLTDGVPKSTNVDHYSAIVKEKRRLRDIITAGNTVVTQAYAETASATIVEQSVRELLTVNRSDVHGAITLGAAVNQYIADFDAASGGTHGYSLGFVDLDQFFAGGVSPRQLLILAARPSIGKSTLAMNIAQQLATQAVPVGFFSLEMAPKVLGEQALARTSMIDVQRLKSRTLADRDWNRIAAAVETLDPLPVHIVEHVRTVTQFDAWCRRLRDEHNIKVVVVDYIQLMGDLRAQNRQQEMAYLSSSIKRTAADLNLLAIAISQLSRAPEERTDKRPRLSDLRESGALEQDADIVLLLFRQDAYTDDPNHPDAGVTEVIVAKNRTGPTGVARLAFLREQLRFADLARFE